MVLVVFALVAALGAWRASKLKLVTDFADLLPQDQPSVVELRRILSRTRGLSNVFVVLEDRDAAKLRRLADALVPRLREVGSPWVESARDGAQEARQFLKPRAGLYMSDKELTDAEDQLAEQERAAFRRRIGADLDEEGEAAQGPAQESGDSREGQPKLRSVFKPLFDRLSTVDRYPDGYFQGPSRAPGVTAQVIVVKAAIAAGDIDGATATFERVRAVVDATLGQSTDRPARVSYAGDLLTGRAEYDLVRRDVVSVGGLGVLMVLGVVLLFYRTVRALLALGGTIGVGCAATFGVTQLALGHLNVATAFLLSIVAGNGVNFGIIWLGRFYEERRGGATLIRAVEIALARTYPATMSAAAAAATAYAALAVGRFRGFRHFAVIGGTGMVLCWITTYALLPALAVLLERRRRRAPLLSFLRRRGLARPRNERVPFTHFERPFIALVGRAPRTTLAVTLALGVVSLVAGARHLHRGAMEYDLRHLQSSRDTHDDLYRASDLANQVLGHSGSGGMVVLVDRVTDAPQLAGILRARRDQVPHAQRPLEDVHILDDLVPPDQAGHLARLQALKRKLQRAHDRGGIDDATWSKLGPLFPPPDLRPFTLADLPAELVEPFTEKDGTKGRVVYIEQTAGESEADLHYLLRLADAFRNTRLPDGRMVYGSGRAVIFADLLHASLVDMPRSVVVSLLLTALTVVLLFRRAGPSAMVLGSLVLALAWVLATMALFDVRLSFINFIALPITFGIGIDYPVNLYARYDQDRAAGVLRAMHGAGGPVILCSLTTSLGYVALLRSHNEAVRSLGALAVLGEASCLAAALLALPAALLVMERRRRRRRFAS